MIFGPKLDCNLTQKNHFFEPEIMIGLKFRVSTTDICRKYVQLSEIKDRAVC